MDLDNGCETQERSTILRPVGIRIVCAIGKVLYHGMTVLVESLFLFVLSFVSFLLIRSLVVAVFLGVGNGLFGSSSTGGALATVSYVAGGLGSLVGSCLFINFLNRHLHPKQFAVRGMLLFLLLIFWWWAIAIPNFFQPHRG